MLIRLMFQEPTHIFDFEYICVVDEQIPLRSGSFEYQ